MINSKRKALYLFLTSLLGILLFLMLHRSLFVIYDILGSFLPNSPIFNVDPVVLYTVDFFSMLVAIFLGGWYGVWLGLDWYKLVYEERQSREWFHSFLPHHWRGYHARNHSSLHHQTTAHPHHHTSSEPKESSEKRVVVKSFNATSSPRIESFSSFKTAPATKPWSFDDVAAPSTATKPKSASQRKAVASASRPKRVVKKKAVAKLS